MNKKTISSLLSLFIWVGLTGCATRLSVAEDKKPLRIKSSGLINSYVACNRFRPYDGTILDAEVLDRNGRWGSLASLDVWPIGGLGISFIGARIKILPFELGLGILGYDPKPESYGNEKKPENPPDEDADVVPQED